MKIINTFSSKFWLYSIITACLYFSPCLSMDLVETIQSRIDKAHNSIQKNYEHLLGTAPYMPSSLSQQFKELVHSLDFAVIVSQQLTKNLQDCVFQLANTDNSVLANRYDDLMVKIAIQIDYLESASTLFRPFLDFQAAFDADLALSLQLQASEDYNSCAYIDPVVDSRSRAKDACMRSIALHLGPTYVPSSLVHMPMMICHGSIPRNGFNKPALPQCITELKGVEILYYPSPRSNLRIAGTCASRAIANALAIRDAITAASLDASTVYSLADTHNDLHSHPSVTHREAIELACALNLKNTFYLNFVEQFSDGKIKDNPFSVTLSTEQHDPSLGFFFNLYTEEKTQAEIINKIRSMPTITAFFLCSVDVEHKNDHCILIAVVKKQGCIPKIIYMDCNNQQVAERSKSAAFIHYIYLQCIC